MECYAPYASATRSTAPFGPAATHVESARRGHLDFRALNGFEFHGALKNDAEVHGRLASYAPGGYIVDLEVPLPDSEVVTADDERAELETALRVLKQAQWLDKGTSAMAVQFNAYNANTRRYTHVQALLEVSTVGEVIPSFTVHQISYEWLRFDEVVCGGLLGLSVLSMMWARTQDPHFKAQMAPIFSTVYVLDFTGLVIFFFASASRIIMVPAEPEFMHETPVYHDMSTAWLHGLCYHMHGCALTLCLFKLLLMLTQAPASTRCALFRRSLTEPAASLLWTALLLLITTGACAYAARMLFGVDMARCTTWSGAVVTLLLVGIGERETTRQLLEGRGVWGPSLVAVVYVLIIFCLGVLALAIITDAFGTLSGWERDAVYEARRQRQLAELQLTPLQKLREGIRKVRLATQSMIDDREVAIQRIQAESGRVTTRDSAERTLGTAELLGRLSRFQEQSKQRSSMSRVMKGDEYRSGVRLLDDQDVDTRSDDSSASATRPEAESGEGRPASSKAMAATSLATTPPRTQQKCRMKRVTMMERSEGEAAPRVSMFW